MNTIHTPVIVQAVLETGSISSLAGANHAEGVVRTPVIAQAVLETGSISSLAGTNHAEGVVRTRVIVHSQTNHHAEGVLGR